MKIRLKYTGGKFKCYTIDNTHGYFDKKSKQIGIQMNIGPRGGKNNIINATMELDGWSEIKFHGKTYYKNKPHDYDILMEKLELELALDKLE